MRDSLQRLLQILEQYPLAQALIIMPFVLVQEDAAIMAVALLTVEGVTQYFAALSGLIMGIVIWDIGLYGFGALIAPWLVRTGILQPWRLRRFGAWVEDHLFTSIIIVRFVPGTRLPAYMGAGLLHPTARRFFFLAMLISVLWVYLLFHLVLQVGELTFPLLGDHRWFAAVAIILLLLTAQAVLLRKKKPLASDEAPPCSWFEFWPAWLFYPPVVAYYLWLALRYRSLTLFSCANPAIYTGGFLGESKAQILDLITGTARNFLPAYGRVRRTESPTDTLAEAGKVLREKGIPLPCVAKPDRGERGRNVQRIPDHQALEAYVHAFPEGETILLQALVDAPREAGVFYYRHPDEVEGHLFSITLKAFPQVTGNGRQTLRDLIQADPRAEAIAHKYFALHAENLDCVLPPDEPYPLVFRGNHCQGAIFRDGEHLATPELKAVFDEIVEGMEGFYFGRFDVRYQDDAAFMRGEDFEIIEVNGAAAEATHIWDARCTLREAYRTLFRQFAILFSISAANRKRGCRPCGPVAVLREIWKFRQS